MENETEEWKGTTGWAWYMFFFLTFFYYAREPFLPKQAACCKMDLPVICNSVLEPDPASCAQVWQEEQSHPAAASHTGYGRKKEQGKEILSGTLLKDVKQRDLFKSLPHVRESCQSWTSSLRLLQTCGNRNGWWGPAKTVRGATWCPCWWLVGGKEELLAGTGDQIPQHRRLPPKPSLLPCSSRMWKSRPASDAPPLTAGQESSRPVCEVLRQEKHLSGSRCCAFLFTYLVLFLSPFNNTRFIKPKSLLVANEDI